MKKKFRITAAILGVGLALPASALAATVKFTATIKNADGSKGTFAIALDKSKKTIRGTKIKACGGFTTDYVKIKSNGSFSYSETFQNRAGIVFKGKVKGNTASGTIRVFSPKNDCATKTVKWTAK